MINLKNFFENEDEIDINAEADKFSTSWKNAEARIEQEKLAKVGLPKPNPSPTNNNPNEKGWWDSMTPTQQGWTVGGGLAGAAALGLGAGYLLNRNKK